MEMMTEVLVRRRLHATNRSASHANGSRSEYLRILKASLDRRRNAGGEIRQYPFPRVRARRSGVAREGNPAARACAGRRDRDCVCVGCSCHRARSRVAERLAEFASLGMRRSEDHSKRLCRLGIVREDGARRARCGAGPLAAGLAPRTARRGRACACNRATRCVGGRTRGSRGGPRHREWSLRGSAGGMVRALGVGRHFDAPPAPAHSDRASCHRRITGDAEAVHAAFLGAGQAPAARAAEKEKAGVAAGPSLVSLPADQCECARSSALLPMRIP